MTLLSKEDGGGSTTPTNSEKLQAKKKAAFAKKSHTTSMTRLWDEMPKGLKDLVPTNVSQRNTLSANHCETHINADISRRAKWQEAEPAPDPTELPFLERIVESGLFKGFIMFLVGANTITMGFEADYPEWPAWGVIEQVFVIAFVVEFIIKVLALRLEYFRDKYNWLDFGLAVLGVVDLWVFEFLSIDAANLRTLSILRILRLFRLVRVLRLIKGSEQLRMVIQGVADAVKCTFWVGLVMFLSIYVSSIFCMTFFGGDKGSHFPGFSMQQEEIARLEIMSEFNPYVYFGSMTKTILTLFSIAFAATWTDVVVPVFWLEPVFIFFFAGFFLLMFGLLNVIIGLIVDKVLHNARKMEDEFRMLEQTERLHLLEKIKNLVVKVDQDHNGVISHEELQQHILSEESGFFEVLRDSDLALPIGCTAEELLCMLDTDGDSELYVDKFVQSFFRLMDSSDFQRMCMLQMGLNSVKHCIAKSQTALEERLTQLEARSSVVGSRPQEAAPSARHSFLQEAGDLLREAHTRDRQQLP